MSVEVIVCYISVVFWDTVYVTSTCWLLCAAEAQMRTCDYGNRHIGLCLQLIAYTFAVTHVADVFFRTCWLVPRTLLVLGRWDFSKSVTRLCFCLLLYSVIWELARVWCHLSGYFYAVHTTTLPSVRLIACSHRRRRQDKTKLSCLVCVGGVNTIGDKTRQFCLVSTQFPIFNCSVSNILTITENLEIGNWVRDQTKLSCLVCSCVHTTDADKTKQSCLVRVGSVNKL